MHLHLITAEDPLTLEARARELIRMPQLTPPQWSVSHTDEITHEVDLDQTHDLVGITAATPSAPRAYELARAFRARGAKVAMGGPHATLLPYEVAEHRAQTAQKPHRFVVEYPAQRRLYAQA